MRQAFQRCCVLFGGVRSLYVLRASIWHSLLWYRVNMGTRAGHAWIGKVKCCPKVADRR
jgi:hypothetical protein